MGRWGGSLGEVSDFGPGHDLTVCEFEPHNGLSAVSTDSSWVTLSLCPSPDHEDSISVSLSLSLKNKQTFKDNKNVLKATWLQKGRTRLQPRSLQLQFQALNH